MTPRKSQVSDVYELKKKKTIGQPTAPIQLSKRSPERLFMLDFGNFKHKHIWFVMLTPLPSHIQKYNIQNPCL